MTFRQYGINGSLICSCWSFIIIIIIIIIIPVTASLLVPTFSTIQKSIVHVHVQ